MHQRITKTTEGKRSIRTFEARYERVGATVRRLSGRNRDCKIARLDASTDLLSPIREFTECVAEQWNYPNRDFKLSETLQGISSRQNHELRFLEKNLWAKRSTAATTDPSRPIVVVGQETSQPSHTQRTKTTPPEGTASPDERNKIISSLSNAPRRAILASDAAVAALSEAGSTPLDKDIWQWIQDCDELDYPGTFGGFSKALRRAREKLGEQKYRPRGGRSGGSTVSRDEV
ncbi:hypothetical protein RESH_05119 [Rhodopirellula europaea SH398]|uniref:Uncharacterized protein n=1 Tax=Rhodopirellula europaea SH398 TaxID=1263868 RepID=M5SDT5_9BACT|nr:hypothetical protein RESH_05119 [Rhodopirellula europaea SH398]